MPARRGFAVVAAVLVLLAGCSVRPPTDAGDGSTATVRLSLQNAADETYAVDVSVLGGPIDGVRITDVDGTNRTVRASSIGEVPPAALDAATRIEPLGEAVRSERYALEPDTGVGDTIADVPRNATVAYAVFRPANRSGPLRSLGTTTCGDDADVVSLSVSIREDGLDVATTCEGRVAASEPPA